MTVALRLHRALVKRKYRLLYTPRRRGRPGPKGPARELIEAVVEVKTAQPVFRLSKDRAANLQRLRYRPQQGRRPAHSERSPSTRTTAERRPLLAGGDRTYQGPPVERRSLPRRVDSAQELLGHGGDGHLHPSNHRFWSCRGQSRRHPGLPDVQSRDRQASYARAPLLRPRSVVRLAALWRANLRVLEVEEIKTIPDTFACLCRATDRNHPARVRGPDLVLE